MYDLTKLGWKSFQGLCLTILREILGQTVSSFLDSHDGGRDGAFAGIWKQSNGEDLCGRYVVQCKFTSRTNYSLTPSSLKDEFNKVKNLVDRKICDVYILMSNANLTSNNEEKITTKLSGLGVKHVRIFGSTWIIQQIIQNQKLRMRVPRLYGLGDLSQILDERAYSQARVILESLHEDLAKVVVTESYQKSLNALIEHNFVLLIGEPASGKTTIAFMLAMAAIDKWNSSILKLNNPDKIHDHWNPEEQTQFFWFDDAFGTSQYESVLATTWNQYLQNMKAMVRRNVKIVLTSRDYIYNRARDDLKLNAFPLFSESQIVIDVQSLTREEKSLILYNHLKFGKQPKEFLTKIKPYLDSVAENVNFIPEIARRLSYPIFTSKLNISKYYLNEFVEKKDEILQDMLSGLDSDSKAAIALIYMRNNKLESPIKLNTFEEEAIERLGSSLGNCINAIQALNTSLVQSNYEEGKLFWHYRHPTIGDAFAKLLSKKPELLEIYLNGIAPDEMIRQITCGDIGIENATIISKSLFENVFEKLSELRVGKNCKLKDDHLYMLRSYELSFLGHRCSKEFLEFYIEKNPDLFDLISDPPLYLEFSSEVVLISLLYKYKLLPEAVRKNFVRIISEYAISGEDLYAFELDQLFFESEMTELLNKIEEELIPNLHDLRIELEASLNSDPDNLIRDMDRLVDNLEILKKHFTESSIVQIIDEEINNANITLSLYEQIIEEQISDYIKFDEPDNINTDRSIFEDIDQ
ncbi:MAG: hypothetical protein ACOWWR_02875 [Eubacteriales bacterium]